jgi:hypothetical protein
MATTDNDPEQVNRLMDEIEQLRREVDHLRADLRDARGRIGLTMKGQSRCPACGCRRLIFAPNVLDRSDSGRQKLAVAQPSVWRTRGVGEFEVFICSGCGLTEWYVKRPEELEEEEEELFRVIEGPKSGDSGPYR